MRVSLLLLPISLLLAPISFAVAEQTPSARIQQVESGLASAEKDDKGEPGLALLDRMKHYDVPGVSIAVIDNGMIAWAKGYGVREKGTDTPVGTDTLFQAASISKPVTATATLQLVQEGKLDLDTNVNSYLKSWQLPENEFTTDHPVTLRRHHDSYSRLVCLWILGLSSRSAAADNRSDFGRRRTSEQQSRSRHTQAGHPMELFRRRHDDPAVDPGGRD